MAGSRSDDEVPSPGKAEPQRELFEAASVNAGVIFRRRAGAIVHQS